MSIHDPYLAAKVKEPSLSIFYRDFGKRLFDVILTVMALPFILPIVAILAFIIALDGGKPFYFQTRIGKGGRHYRMWKLRTMVRDADACLEHHLRDNPDLRREWDSNQKLLNDPRITSIGHFLRASSIDELPQFFNVLMGDMSIVGPRPMMVSQKSMYSGKAYYDLLPGITGPWQVSARHLSTFVGRVNYDTRYKQSLSFTADLAILVATVKVVLSRSGC
jgi:lipopolysaccharide/colanic/teichoic acid biosynthesis glycosyltransferase